MTPAELRDTVRAAVQQAVGAGLLDVDVPDNVVVERPRNREHGDYATTVALQLAKPAGRRPREVADLLAERLRLTPGIERVDVAGPGFLNLTLAAAATGEIARSIIEAGSTYGSTDTLAGHNINLEFVSANPTGPLHIGHVRWAAVGDALARLLAASGAAVTREFYINDTGIQMDRFAASLLARARRTEIPADGYAGAYVDELARQIVDRNPGLLAEPEEKQLEVFGRDGLELMLAEIQRSLADFGVAFDVYFPEHQLHEAGELEAAVEKLRAVGHVYDADGAVWLRTTDFGDDKDRVLVKRDGTTTYFTADAAYYLDKRQRGFARLILLLGADHHGYLGRMRALAACFGDDPDTTLEILIGQLVTVVKDGRPLRMSKRAGTMLTLEDLLELVGTDAARYTLARSSTDSALDIDVDLVTRQSADNPVYYVQYVAARTAGVRRNAEALGIRYDAGTVDVGLLASEQEGELLRALGEFPRIVASAAELRAPHRVARYLEESVAPAFHRFYDACRVLPVGDEHPTELHAARLMLIDATRTVVANGLGLLGVSAPERM